MRQRKRFSISYGENCFELEFDPLDRPLPRFSFFSENEYIFYQLKMYGIPEAFVMYEPSYIAEYIEKVYKYVSFVRTRRGQQKHRSLYGSRLDQLCSRAHGRLRSQRFIDEYEETVNEELQKYLSVLTDCKYDGRIVLKPGLIERNIAGQCSYKGGRHQITLDETLIFNMEADEIREIIVHELCHTKYMSHGPKFWHAHEDALCRLGLLHEEERIISKFFPKSGGQFCLLGRSLYGFCI